MNNTIYKVLLFTNLLFFSGCTTEINKPQTSPEITKVAIINQQKETESTEEDYNDNENLYPIISIFDGDTYKVLIDGKAEKVRVIGIDTPEKEGGFRPEGCYGDHASIYAKEALTGKSVALLSPQNYENTDKYGRLLRYVFLDGKDFGGHLIEEGYAFSYKKFSHPRKKYYNTLEKKSQKNKKGMWNSENCDYWGQSQSL